MCQVPGIQQLQRIDQLPDVASIKLSAEDALEGFPQVALRLQRLGALVATSCDVCRDPCKARCIEAI